MSAWVLLRHNLIVAIPLLEWCLGIVEVEAHLRRVPGSDYVHDLVLLFEPVNGRCIEFFALLDLFRSNDMGAVFPDADVLFERILCLELPLQNLLQVCAVIEHHLEWEVVVHHPSASPVVLSVLEVTAC